MKLSIEGIIVNTGERRRGRIEIDQDSGLIERISNPTGKADVVLEEEFIFPGFIDLHVHAREDVSHREDYKEDFVSAGKAAINGGVVAFAEMPNNPIPPVDDESYGAKHELTKKSPVPVFLYAGIGKHTKPLSENVPYKVFMGQSVGDMFFSSRSDLEAALSAYEGKHVSFHCEDPEILEQNTHAETHEKRRPSVAETRAVDFAIKLIEKYNLTGKICHCSTLEGVHKIIEAKKRGVNITVEVTPHHLYFDEVMFMEDERRNFQVNPPIRQSEENRLGLIELLKKGDIDYLATDHAPHTTEEKAIGVSGLPHLDTYGLFTAWLLSEHNFTPAEIARVASLNPGNFINKFLPKGSGKYGKIEEGHIGSLTIIDTNKTVAVKKSILKTKCGWSPFEGVTFPGGVSMTIVKGTLYKNES